MRSRWSDEEASRFLERLGKAWGSDLALRTYTSRLLGAEPDLVLHGGGNSSVKSGFTDILGERIGAVYVKASGRDMASIGPEGHVPLDLDRLLALRALVSLSDEAMLDELRTRRLRAAAPDPSIESLVHAFIPAAFVDHTHAGAVLALTNQKEGERLVREALGDEFLFLDYVKPGFALAKAAARAFEAQPGAKAMIWSKHGLLTWGSSARESYEATIETVSRAETYIAERGASRARIFVPSSAEDVESSRRRLATAAPVIRGLLNTRAGGRGEGPGSDVPRGGFVLEALVDRDILGLLASARGREIALSPPLTTDHLIRTKARPVWIDAPAFDDPERLRARIADALTAFADDYIGYVERHAARMPEGLAPLDPLPRVLLLPGLGGVCAGRDAAEAALVRDIAAHTLRVKTASAGLGRYEGPSEAHLFEMEYHTLQQAKLPRRGGSELAGHVSLVTGAAGAIGSGICRELLLQGSHVALTDLPGARLDDLTAGLGAAFGNRVLGVGLDVTNESSVASAFERVARAWGGVDLVVINAGIAHVSPIEEMDLEAFRRLERVNVEGTVVLLREAARHFRLQAAGGDVVLISTKNVFSPGASFGAYSATKAAAHQLARIASLEMAPIDVRVNMVSPDAVFSEGTQKSGLWEEVGPELMRARGLDAAGLVEHYRGRSLLKTEITPRHVARAVLFFATRQTPTTGATIPVDGGLPDATPR